MEYEGKGFKNTLKGIDMASVKKGDLVRLEYTGRLASDGKVFDTTDESVARSAGIYDSAAIYGPKLAVFGSGTMIAGLEEAIISASPGKTEEFTILPPKAFGEKNPEQIRMLPEKEFHKQQVRPVAGMALALDGAIARVKSVTSGRVVVDMNHPLAGETVVYSVKVDEVISETRKKMEAVLASHGLAAKIEERGKGYTVVYSKTDDQKKVASASRIISAMVPGTGFSVV